MSLYQGTIAFDPPDLKVRSDMQTRDWRANRARDLKRAWSDANRAHLREYNREYMRIYRRKHAAK